MTNTEEKVKLAIQVVGDIVAPNNFFVPDEFGQNRASSTQTWCMLHLTLQEALYELQQFKRGELVDVRKLKDKDGQPDYDKWIVWEVNRTHVYVCRIDEYNKWCKKELGTVTINGKVFDEVPWHAGVPKRDIRRIV